MVPETLDLNISGLSLPLHLQSTDQSRKVLVTVLCTGNTCRSPLVQAFLTQYLSDLGLSDIVTVQSAGTGNPDAKTPSEEVSFGHPMMLYTKIKAKDEKVGSHLPQRNSQEATLQMLENSDLVFVVAPNNKQRLQKKFPERYACHESRIHVFGTGHGIPDPYTTEGKQMADDIAELRSKNINPFEENRIDPTQYNIYKAKYAKMGDAVKEQIGHTLQIIVDYLLEENIVTDQSRYDHLV